MSVGLIVALAFGCAIRDRPPLEVTVRQGRLAATRGQIQFGMVPVDGAAVDIAALQLRDPRFVEVSPTPRLTTVDRSLDIALDIGEAICEGIGSGSPRAAITVPTAREPILLPVASDGDEVLTKLHATACARRTVLDAAELRFGPDWSLTGPATAEGTITITRAASDQPVVLTQVEGTVIFTLRVLTDPDAVHGGTGSSEIARLEREERQTEVPVEISAARCDAHALAESKKTFLFPVWVSVAEAEPVFLTLEPRDEARAVFDELMTVGCHL